MPTITTFKWVPQFARGYIRDMRTRWAFEETGQPYAVDYIDFDQVKSAAHRRSTSRRATALSSSTRIGSDGSCRPHS
ncbi:MAG: hypothetical protein M3N02_00690 [Pseudomonadota bacterium]|nr:hypothetical protein [Pseudomonadota bacterium]